MGAKRIMNISSRIDFSVLDKDIREYAAKNGISMQEMSRRIGYCQTYIYEMMRSKRLSKAGLISICNLIGTEPERYSLHKTYEIVTTNPVDTLPTQSQMDYICLICNSLGIEFHGKTKTDAQIFISKFVNNVQGQDFRSELDEISKQLQAITVSMCKLYDVIRPDNHK